MASHGQEAKEHGHHIGRTHHEPPNCAGKTESSSLTLPLRIGRFGVCRGVEAGIRYRYLLLLSKSSLPCYRSVGYRLPLTVQWCYTIIISSKHRRTLRMRPSACPCRPGLWTPLGRESCAYGKLVEVGEEHQCDTVGSMIKYLKSKKVSTCWQVRCFLYPPSCFALAAFRAIVAASFALF